MLQIRMSRAGATARELGNGVEFYPGFPRRAQSLQAAAATATATAAWCLDAGLPVRARFISYEESGVGESMVIDVKRIPLDAAAVSILLAPVAFPQNSAEGIVVLPLDPAARLVAGDQISVVRTYVAGGGPTMAATVVILDYAEGAQPV